MKKIIISFIMIVMARVHAQTPCACDLFPTSERIHITGPAKAVGYVIPYAKTQCLTEGVYIINHPDIHDPCIEVRDTVYDPQGIISSLERWADAHPEMAHRSEVYMFFCKDPDGPFQGGRFITTWFPEP